MSNYIRTLTINYDLPITQREIPLFRGAVIASLEHKDVLFHNHTGEETLRYSYPLIQYKPIHKKAAVMGIGKGIDAITHLLSIPNYNFQIGKRSVEMHIESVNAYDHEISLASETDFRYRLRNWLPLNSSNYAQYQNAESMVERIIILERVLIGNILSFFKGLDLFLDNQIQLHITDITGQHAITYKRVKLMAFDIEFKANISLPQYIGVGKNASIGFGILSQITNLNFL